MIRNGIFAVLATALAISAVAPAEAQDDVLRIGVEGAYPPFSWRESDGTLAGFDIDIAVALCDEMGRPCELVEQEWDGMIPALLANRFDAIIASMAITDERRQQVDFSNKYYSSPAFFVAHDDTALEPTPDGLAGLRIGVQRGTIHQCYMEAIFPDAELVLYATQEEVFQDLAAGRLDAQISESLAALEGFLNTEQGQEFRFHGEEQFLLECHGEGAGIALRPEDDELREAFNAAIVAIRNNGAYAEINDRYFEVDIYGAE